MNKIIIISKMEGNTDIQEEPNEIEGFEFDGEYKYYLLIAFGVRSCVKYFHVITDKHDAIEEYKMIFYKKQMCEKDFRGIKLFSNFAINGYSFLLEEISFNDLYNIYDSVTFVTNKIYRVTGFNSLFFNDDDGSWGLLIGSKYENELQEPLQIVKGDYIVQRYLLDDLWETEQVDYI